MGLAVGEIEFSDLFKVIWKEIRIAFLYQHHTIGGEWNPYHADGTGRCHDGIYHWSDYGLYSTDRKSGRMYTTIGCEKIGLDPAIMATPLISTLVDISTISVYFAIVSHVFQL